MLQTQVIHVVLSVEVVKQLICQSVKGLNYLKTQKIYFFFLFLDHKPEDEDEKKRIENAGGRVTLDGRVNGGLNLSRAIGDHTYKKNKDLDLEKQMITSLPDVKVIDIEESDEFMILACDGIWNSMTSQECVDYVRDRMNVYPKLSQIVEEVKPFNFKFKKSL